MKPTFNILMYSHDTYGLGHIRRSMAIAEHLSRPDTNILILTGSPMAGRFKFPESVDYVRIPGMIKKTNDEYFPLAIRIDPRHAMEIRKSIILATVTTFLPDLFIVDKEPLGLKKEVLPTLEWIREHLPSTRTVLGLRDVMDDAAVVRKDWTDKGVYDAMESLYSEVWVYGEQAFYDPVSEYAIPDAVTRKLHFTGYIPRRVPEAGQVRRLRRRLHLSNGDPLITVTTGGGGDGFHVLDTYLAMLEEMTAASSPPPFRSVMVTGPFLSRDDYRHLVSRAGKLNVKVYEFFTSMESLFAASDLVVCMGGYNTLCEILSQKRIPLVIPRETPRREQSIRARALKRENLLDFIAWKTLSPRALREKIFSMLENRDRFYQAMQTFELTGIQQICQRIVHFRSTPHESTSETNPMHGFERVPENIRNLHLQ